MLFYHLTFLIYLLHPTLHFSPARADHLNRISCDCGTQSHGYDFSYTSARLHTTHDFHTIATPYNDAKYDETCTHFSNHEFCYNRNLSTRDEVRLDSKKKHKLPKKGRRTWGVYDCTGQCRRWFGLESACNKTGGYWHRTDGGTDEWVDTVQPICEGKAWDFPDL
ncbi:MAG: hypothetical protein M1830_005165 [Pleopsidium flavum]|nr:MAG: hypothetical protein M1830_005165 [Pleopsidium flavum]